LSNGYHHRGTLSAPRSSLFVGMTCAEQFTRALGSLCSQPNANGIIANDGDGSAAAEGASWDIGLPDPSFPVGVRYDIRISSMLEETIKQVDAMMLEYKPLE
jgi:hypothetical protein